MSVHKYCPECGNPVEIKNDKWICTTDCGWEGEEVFDLAPCPKCKGPVEWSNSRDRNLLSEYIMCDQCDLIFFSTETPAFILLPNLDYESAKLKYNAWCKTAPHEYGEDRW